MLIEAFCHPHNRNNKERSYQGRRKRSMQSWCFSAVAPRIPGERCGVFVQTRRSLHTVKAFWELMSYETLLLTLWIRFCLLRVKASAVLFKTMLSSLDICSIQVIAQYQNFQRATLLWQIDCTCGQIFCFHFFSLSQKTQVNNWVIKINVELLWENTYLIHLC